MTDVSFHSFEQPIRAVVIGATGGIGAAFVAHLAQHEAVESIIALSRSEFTYEGDGQEKLSTHSIDITDEASIQNAAAYVADSMTPNLIITSVGILHNDEGLAPEKALKELSAAHFKKNFAINVIGPSLVLKHFTPLLPRNERSVVATLSARVGSISDNQIGGWHAYRASKAAMNMMTKGAAIEVARKFKQACIIGLHPGTVDTNLSKPFQSNVADKKLFTSEFSAASLLNVIDAVSPQNSGSLFAWDGKVIPF